MVGIGIRWGVQKLCLNCVRVEYNTKVYSKKTKNKKRFRNIRKTIKDEPYFPVVMIQT